ncbi:VCBS repeat-containing protein [candidate division KSB1 bacterium]|nr:VCBS repeat-containing protein [candidate division KSB1 bacterium]
MIKNRAILIGLCVGIFVSTISSHAQPQHTKLLYFDSLLNEKSTSLGEMVNINGRFLQGWGWQSQYESSQLFITLPEDLPPEGTLEVMVTNFDPWNQNNLEGLKQHIINLWSRPEADKSVFYTDASWINVRTQRNNNYSSGEGRIGFKFLTQPRGFDSREEDYYMKDKRWRDDQHYRFRIIWTSEHAYVSVDNSLKAIHDFSGQVEPFRYIFLGKDGLIYGYCAQVGVIFYDLHIYAAEPSVESPVQFTDITAAANVRGFSDEGYGQGVTFVDVDRNGLVDIFVANASDAQAAPVLLYMNQGAATFIEQATARGISHSGKTYGVLAADFDLDDDPDAGLANAPMQENDLAGRNDIYQNSVSGSFTGISETVGINREVRSTSSCLALDVEGDGDLDLCVINADGLNEMYINDGDGQLQQQQRGIEGMVEDSNFFLRRGATCGDVDGDGDIDIYICCYQKDSAAVGNRLYINDGNGTFQEQAEERGVSAGGRSNGATFSDIDRDGDLDLFVIRSPLPNGPIPKLGVYINDGGGHFQDLTDEYDLVCSGYTVMMNDVDNDADVDMLILSTSEDDPDTRAKLYLNDGFAQFTMALNSGVDVPAASLHGGAAADIDNDGDVDLYLTNADGQNYLLRNDLQSNYHYLRVFCRGPLQDYGGIGTKVFLYEAGHLGDHNYLLGFQQAGLPFGMMCQNEPILHFGLGQQLVCDMQVIWSDGRVRDYAGVTADQVIIVEPGMAEKIYFALLQGDGQTGIVAQPLTDSLQVAAHTSDGTPVASFAVTFSVRNGGGWVNGDTITTVKTNAYGVASVCWRLGEKAGMHYLTVTGADTTFQVSARANAGAAAKMIKSGGDDQLCVVGAEFVQPFSVRIVDMYENPVADHPVDFFSIDGGGHLRGYTQRTETSDEEGFVQVWWTAGPYFGPDNRLQASSEDTQLPLAGSPVVWFYPGKPIDVASSTIVANTPVIADGIAQSTITVALKDTAQQPAGEGYTVDLQVGGSENVLTLADTLTDDQGRVAALLSSTKAERKIVRARIKGLDVFLADSAVIEFYRPVNIADSLAVIAGNDQVGIVDQYLPAPFKVQVLNVQKRPIADYDVRFVVIAGSGKINGSDTSCTKTDVNGYATALLRLGTRAGRNNQLIEVWAEGASNAPLVLSASAMADAPVQLLKVSGDSQVVRRGNDLPLFLQVALYDRFGNGVADYPVRFSALLQGQVITSQPVLTDSSGLAGSEVMVSEITGEQYFLVEATGLSPIFYKVTVVPNSPPQILAYTPEENNFSSSHTTILEFAITETADGDDDTLLYKWFVNNQFSGDDSSFTLIPQPHMGERITVVGQISDRRDSVAVTWNVRIIVTETELTNPIELPMAWLLKPNFPNPFNPSTTFQVEAPDRQEVQLLIYDIHGRLIQTLFEGSLSPGFHSFVWDGRDTSGRMRSSGIYICMLKFATQSLKQRIVLIK